MVCIQPIRNTRHSCQGRFRSKDLVHSSYGHQINQKNNEEWVRFSVYPLQKNSKVKVNCSARLVGKRLIKASFGISEERLIITIPITIGEDTFNIELSLANRNTMEFRMLLGPEAMVNRHAINPGAKLLQKEHLRKEVSNVYIANK